VGSAGIAKKLNDFRSGDTDLADDDKDLLRVFADARYQYRYGYYAEARMLHTEGHGNSVEDPSLTWLNFQLDNGYYDGPSLANFNYMLSLYYMNGEVASPAEKVSVGGWAADVGVRVRPDATPLALGFHYSVAPGKGDGGYRQTGLQSNRSRFTGTRTAFHRYNEALRAQFSNMQVMTIYGSYFYNSLWDASLVYQRFIIDKPELGIDLDGLSLVPNSESKNVGHGVDLVVTRHLGYLSFAESLALIDSYVRVRLSNFVAGAAFDRADLEDHRMRLALDWVMRW
jgi:alginate production protein